ncbi:hypothetical protein DE146DRAFT_604110 [Phaeosphaeria sp. MPI-PUGE-AT-0046c]|nr:hypothetical protein DE146DRAFT_604110 [Phaeosphaeria sp. MPI-PUGE-AT-0046c]
METPKSARQSSDPADTPDTRIPSIFDSDDSPLSSPQSLTSSCSGESPINGAREWQHPTQPDKESQHTTAWANLHLFGTAASHRAQRTRKAPKPYPGYLETHAEVFEEEHVPDTLETAAALTAAPEQNERGVRSKSNPNPTRGHVPAAPAPTHQLRKRKAASSTLKAEYIPPVKKVKTKTPKPAAASKSKSRPRKPAAKDPARRSMRTIRPPERLRAITEENSEEVSVRSALILKLKMYDGWRGELQRPSSIKSTIDLTFASNLTASPHESSSFGSAGKQSTYESQEQCAQPVLAPISASTQSSSNNGSQIVDFTSHSQAVDPTSHAHDPIPAEREKPAPVQNRSTQKDTDVDSNATTEDEGDFNMPQPRPLLSDQQQYLHDLSKQLFSNRSLGMVKPAPLGQPEVWADGRQELCETLHYFRSYQSACYSTGGFVRAFMFDKAAHPRDYIDGDVIISRAGGGLEKDKDSGKMKSNSDQKPHTPIAQALKNCMKHLNPLVIITGVDNPYIPAQPPHQYCVLDNFKPTHIWSEKSDNKILLRYRFEKLNTKKESWWRSENDQTVVELGALEPPVEHACVSCGQTSTQIYLNGWMCLQPHCEAFWRIINDLSLGSYKISHEPDEASLIYDPRFLKQKTPWPNDNTEYPLAFMAPEISSHAIAGEDTSQAFWSGMVCPDCVSFAHGYRINCYSIPGLNGFITHMIANKTVLEEPGGPDDMFEELQQTEIGLRRRAMPNGQLKGESYCRHFSVNYGMPYKFIAATASHSFDGAARPITATRSRLNWAARHLLGSTHNTDEEFNEVLALGYFEAQKINYHDDGEFGLGPTIATLSLGAPGTMRIRMKARPFHGCSSAQVYDASRPLPGCESYEQRLALHPELEALKASDPKAYRARLKQIPKELKLRHSGNAKDVLKMELGHGDVVVMHGAEVQKYYEHAVEHAGKLRFALTCRYIDPESLGEGDKPNYAVGRDEGGYDGSRLC